MLNDRSREALDDLLTKGDGGLLHVLANEPAEAIATWLCDERNLPAAMAEEIVSRVSAR